MKSNNFDKFKIEPSSQKPRKPRKKSDRVPTSIYQDFAQGETWREGLDGTMELLNEKGEIIERAKRKPIVDKHGNVQASNKKRGRAGGPDTSHHIILDGNGKKHLVPKGTNPDHMPNTVYPYCQVTCDHILRFISEGHTLTAVGAMEGLPPAHVISRWTREYPEFRNQMAEAKKLRAEIRADRVIAIADQGPIHEKDVPGERLRKDILQWGSEMDDRSTYGKQVKNIGEQGNLTIVIQTGVPEPITVQVEIPSQEGSEDAT